MRIFYCLIICFSFFSCQDDVVPKPKGYLRLHYPEAKYEHTAIDAMPFTFEANRFANKVTSKKLNSPTESYGINIEDGENEVAILCACIVIDQILEKEQNSDYSFFSYSCNCFANAGKILL